MDDIILKSVVNTKIVELLTAIHIAYPTEFDDTAIRDSYIYIKKHLRYVSTKPEPIATSAIRPLIKKTLPEDSKRCIARCWNDMDINGTRCKRGIKSDDMKLCTQHAENLPHGLFGDEITPILIANFKKYCKKESTSQTYNITP